MYQKVDYSEKECVFCGSTFKPKTKSSRFCCKPCSRAHWIENNPEVAAECKRKAREQTKAKGYSNPLRGPFSCKNCGKQYSTRRPAGEGEKYCSRGCAFADIKTWVRRGDVAPKFSKVRFAACLVCGVVFRAVRTQQICSDECRKKRAGEMARIKSEDQHNPGEKVCKECGKKFIPVYGSMRRVFCSGGCSKRYNNRKKEHGNNRKRARKYGVPYEYINSLKVLRRDGWTCQICGRKTPERLRGTTKPNAPELDHRIPISTGGGHTWDNVQCACRECNGNKGNTKPIGQMNLFNNAA